MKPSLVGVFAFGCLLASRNATAHDCRGETDVSSTNASYIICIDVGATHSLDIEKYPQSVVIAPNSVGAVWIRFPPGDDVPPPTITGTIGIFTPPMMGGAAAAPAHPHKVFQIAPRMPGPVTIDIKVVNSGGNVVNEIPIELIVDKTYSGAFRLGFAGIFGSDAQDKTFDSKKFPGSNQSEVVQSSQTPIELLLGYSLFFDGFRGGRSYVVSASGGRYLLQHLGLFIGVGIVSVSGAGADWLKSLHLGLEWEFSPNFAIEVTAVARRVTTLQNGVEVGSPVPDSGVPTATKYAFGGAVVLSVSPDFFRFATQLSK